MIPRKQKQLSELGAILPMDVREPVLNACLRLAAVGGILILVQRNLPDPNFNPWHPVMILLMLVQAWVVAAALMPRIRFELRVAALAFFCSVIGTTALVYLGPVSGVNLFMLCCILLGGLTIGHRAVVWIATGITVLYIVAGYGWTHRLLPPSDVAPGFEGPSDPGFWISNGLSFAVCGGIIYSTVFFLLSRLNRHHEGEREMLTVLAREQAMRAASEIERLRSEAEVASMLSAAPVGIALLRDRRVVQANRQLAEIYGYSLQEIVGRDPGFISGDQTEYDRLQDMLSKELSFADHARMEAVHRRRSGELFPVLLTAAAVAPTSPASGVVVTVTDISALKNTEAALRRQERGLREILDNTREVIFAVRVTQEGRFVLEDGNAALARYGLCPEDFREGTKSPRDLFPAEQAEIIERAYRDCVSGRESITLRQELELARGSRVFLTTLVPAFDEAGQVRRIVGLAHDVTESERADGLERSKLAADAANRAKSAFLANMSHEIRTPLNAILGFAQIMRRNPRLDPEQREHLAIINRNGEHLLTLIDEVLEISRVEANKAQIASTVFSPAVLLEEVVSTLAPRARQKGLELCAVRSPGLFPAVETDQQKLRQILLNLVGNAIKFTPAGSVEVSADNVTDEVGVAWLRFEVRDTGPGLSEHEQEQLFRPFTQTELGRKAGGAGLGLAISRHYAQLLGGDLTLESAQGRGASFRVSVKVRRAAKTAESAVRIEGQGPLRLVLPAGAPAPRILVVDDMADNRALLCELLRPAGFAVREASDGETGVEIAKTWRPDCVLMDLRLPGIDGVEAMRQIRATGENIRLIGLSASVFPAEREEFISAGADDFLPKPIAVDALFDRIANQLGLRFGTESAISVVEESADGVGSAGLILPPGWIGNVRQAAAEADLVRVRDLIAMLTPSSHPFVRRLETAALAYDYEGLSVLLDTLPSPS